MHFKTYRKNEKTNLFYHVNSLFAIGTGLFTHQFRCSKSRIFQNQLFLIQEDKRLWEMFIIRIDRNPGLADWSWKHPLPNGDPITAGKSGNRSANLLTQGEYEYGNSEPWQDIWQAVIFYAVIDPAILHPGVEDSYEWRHDGSCAYLVLIA